MNSSVGFLVCGPSSGTIRHVSISVYKNEEDSPSQLYDYGGYPNYKSGCLGVAFPALGYVERYTYTPIKWRTEMDITVILIDVCL